MAGFSVPGLPDLEQSSIGIREVETEGQAKRKESKQIFRYGPADAVSIQGVAWHVNESILKDYPDYFPTAVDLLKPKYKPFDFPVAKYDEEDTPFYMRTGNFTDDARCGVFYRCVARLMRPRC